MNISIKHTTNKKWWFNKIQRYKISGFKYGAKINNRIFFLGIILRTNEVTSTYAVQWRSAPITSQRNPLHNSRHTVTQQQTFLPHQQIFGPPQQTYGPPKQTWTPEADIWTTAADIWTTAAEVWNTAADVWTTATWICAETTGSHPHASTCYYPLF